MTHLLDLRRVVPRSPHTVGARSQEVGGGRGWGHALGLAEIQNNDGGVLL